MIFPFEMPPRLPIGYTSFHDLPKDVVDKIGLADYKNRISPIYHNPKTLLELCACDVLYSFGVFDHPPKVKWWRQILFFLFP